MMLERFVDAAEGLLISPMQGQVVELEQPHDLREIPVLNYRMLYRIRGERLQIVTLFHGSREFPTDLD